ncbi:NAD-dependent epimerase/dehydratase family protein [Streptomyces sp. AJS327]|uniref:NAD-dependent epimerase/dehydratase family protein n=1 Tax=Streptomyces sp. AJS327 TaxID=2545265 RepID=UPI0015E0046D|nr:NAD-dependent epimerase/dehydratase family protein [Streptomyces sp. AJS327]MBA0049529.1 NAD-dependent epimerase/dehydratase family protein [Streptomyces sp. AJS327]QTC09984.1 NAD-dependent epimerase/dehydratase [Streptomyces sp.]
MAKRGTAAVVGGRGFIGGAIVEALRATGWDVTVVTHNQRLAAHHAGYRWGDMLDPTTLGPAVEGADVVVQSANFPNYPFERPQLRHTFLEYDGLGTERLVRAARDAGVRRYVFISGVGVTENPSKPYYRAIRRGEQAVTESGMEHLVVRPAFVYGPRDNGINRIIRAARALPVLPLPQGGDQLHQPVFADDIGTVVSQAMDSDGPQGTFEIGGPDRMSMAHMLRTALDLVGRGRRVVTVPDRVSRPGARLLAKLPGPLITPNALDFMVEDFVADTEPLLKEFDLRLTPFEEGLRDYLVP